MARLFAGQGGEPSRRQRELSKRWKDYRLEAVLTTHETMLLVRRLQRDLTAEIEGLAMASRNVADGQSLVDTAEGAHYSRDTRSSSENERSACRRLTARYQHADNDGAWMPSSNSW